MVVCEYLHTIGRFAAAFAQICGTLSGVGRASCFLRILHRWLWYSILGVGQLPLYGAFLDHHAHRAVGHFLFPVYHWNVVLQKQVVAALRQRLLSVKTSNICIFTGVTFAGMIVVHGLIPPLFVAFITATVTIILLCICPLPVWLTNLLCYFGEHSTNIWLVHMFFYGSLFHGIVFCLKYPIPVLLLLIAFSLASSYVIKWLSRPILKLVR